ncbi:MAG: hypothetical protein QXG73_02560 [Candidatus Micrarchaeaceae archaeon]
MVLSALESVKKGATVAVADIYSTSIPEMDYAKYLFGEKKLIGIEANTRQDAIEYLDLIGEIGIRAKIEMMPLEKANEALLKVKQGASGSIVLKI